MNSITTETGGFDKVIFESVNDTLAGGASLDVTGFTNTDGVIPAGTLVGPKNASTGLHPIVIYDNDDTAIGGVVPVGFTHATIPLVAAGNNFVGVVTEGSYRPAALPVIPVTALIAIFKTTMPNLRAVS